MTFNYDNVYVLDTSTIVGPYEGKGPLKKYFDKIVDDLYFGKKTWELAEINFLEKSIDILLKKTKLKQEKIDLIIAGDLLNQITSSCYGVLKYNSSFLGIYSACATSCEGMIIAGNFIDSGKFNNIIISTSSHNMSSEKQFRNPTEYGSLKPDTATFTATGGASILLTNKKTNIKVDSGTIGTIVNYKQKDPYNMGAVMAPACAKTIYEHLKNTNRNSNYYDLILSGDLGIYGKKILLDFMEIEYGIDISKNYNDCGTILYDLEKQKEIKAGGSGPVCSCLVNYSLVFDKLKKKKLKKVLLVATGALFSPTMVFQNKDILSIAHAISLEVID